VNCRWDAAGRRTADPGHPHSAARAADLLAHRAVGGVGRAAGDSRAGADRPASEAECSARPDRWTTAGCRWPDRAAAPESRRVQDPVRPDRAAVPVAPDPADQPTVDSWTVDCQTVDHPTAAAAD
jgi:hypothetical protein